MIDRACDRVTREMGRCARGRKKLKRLEPGMSNTGSSLNNPLLDAEKMLAACLGEGLTVCASAQFRDRGVLRGIGREQIGSICDAQIDPHIVESGGVRGRGFAGIALLVEHWGYPGARRTRGGWEQQAQPHEVVAMVIEPLT